MNINEDELRSCRYKIDKNSEVLNRMTDQIAAKYSKQLDDIINKFKDKLLKPEKLGNDEIEKLTMLIPTMLYFTVSGLENLGVDTDSAKAAKLDIYNETFTAVTGTIPDKEAEAESASTKEKLIEIIFSRAYKKLKIKTEVALQLSMSTRKVLEKRIQEINVDKMDGLVIKKDNHY